jgi:hypothetical protein
LGHCCAPCSFGSFVLFRQTGFSPSWEGSGVTKNWGRAIALPRFGAIENLVPRKLPSSDGMSDMVQPFSFFFIFLVYYLCPK